MNTDDLAKVIVDHFDEFLANKDIKVPCADEDEENERDDENYAALYGTEYWQLVDWVSGLLDGYCDFDEEED